MVQKICIILVTYLFFSKCDDAFFVIKKHGEEQYYCITNSSSALSWIPENSKQALYQESEFLPVRIPKHGGLMCNKNENFKYQCTKSREIVLDRRWEEFLIVKSSAMKFRPIANISDSDFEIAFSARVTHNSDVFLCEGINVTASNCYRFLLQTNGTVLRKCANCTTNLAEKQHSLSPKMWSHFVIIKTGNILSLSKINTGNSQILVQINDNDVFSPTKMIIRSEEISFWKIHEVEASKFTRIILNLNVYTFVVDNGSLCISMFIKSCPFCQFSFKLRGNDFRNGVINKYVFEPQSEWHEIKITAQNISVKNATLWLSTLTNSTNQKGQFWFYSSVRYCSGSDFRMIQTSQKATCQLVFNDTGIEVLEKSSQSLNNTCPDNTIGHYCIPCWWFTSQKECGLLKICQNSQCYYNFEVEKQCFDYRYLLLLLLLVLLIPMAIIIKKRFHEKSMGLNKDKICITELVNDEIPLEILPRYVASQNQNINKNFESVTNQKQNDTAKIKSGKTNDVIQTHKNEDLTRYVTSPGQCKKGNQKSNGSKNPIQVNDFPNYVKALLQTDDILEEFLTILKSCTEKCVSKNLFLDYFDLHYLSGHRVPKVYSASLVPKEKQFDDFWKLIWDENIENIVLLDNSATLFQVHSKNYWPSMNEKLQFGAIIVKCTAESIYQHYEQRQFSITFNNKSRLLEQLRFRKCTEYDTPLVFVPFFQKMSKIALKSNSPILVHCSLGTAGAGFALICDMALRIAEKDGAIDIFGKAQQLSTLQNNGEYYKLAHLVILESLLLTKKDGGLYSNCGDNFENCLCYMNETLWIDELMKNKKERDEYFKAHSSDYIGEVFFKSFFPNEEFYSLMETVHGSLIDGFKYPHKYLMTRQPSSQNLENFWKMTIKMNVTVIVSLTSICEENCEIDFPTGLKLKFENLNNFGIYSCVTVHLLHDELKVHKTIEMFSIPKWPPSAPDFVHFCMELQNSEKNATSVLVTCPDGVSASGMYVAIDNMISQLQEENTCDLCISIRSIRQHCPNFCKGEDDLQFLWEASKCQLNAYQLYEICQ